MESMERTYDLKSLRKLKNHNVPEISKSVCILSSEMSKAFDSVHHNLLVTKLKAYGLTENSMKLINSYFQDRENRTRIQDTASSWKPMRRGCPQGSS